MLFNSIEFFVFFVSTTLAYFALPLRGRQILLLLASCGFYMAFIPKYILILFVAIVIDYAAGLLIAGTASAARRRAYLWISIVATCALLFVFKYFNFFRESVEPICRFFGISYAIPALEIILPIGLSFHTFQSLSYVIEVYRGRQKVERDFLIYALYVMFYPQLVAGPIERPQNVLHQFHVLHPFEYTRVTHGLKLMAWGLFKKVVIADHLVLLVDKAYGDPSAHSGPVLILASVFFAFQIYCDFSGYSDIAIGSAQVLGFHLMTNFDRPYFAKSVSEFWRRWHISLSTWFKDYVYIPLGGNQGGEGKTARNLMITFILSGLWHGANFTYIVWGALNGVYLVVARLRDRALASRTRARPQVPPALAALGTFILIDLTWVFFRAPSLEDAVRVLRRFFEGWSDFAAHFLWRRDGVPALDRDVALPTIVVGLVLIAGLLMIERALDPKRARELMASRPAWVRWPAYVALASCIFLFWSRDKTQFIYFQF